MGWQEMLSELGMQPTELNLSSMRKASLRTFEEIDDICDAFEQQWRADEDGLKGFLERMPAVHRPVLFHELLLIDLQQRLRRGLELPPREGLLQRFPEHGDDIRGVFDAIQSKSVENSAEALELLATIYRTQEPPALADVDSTEPGASTGLGTEDTIAHQESGTPSQWQAGASEPMSDRQQFGDYEFIEELGFGGMGVVYKARQLSADRIVALKLIRPDRLSQFRADERESILSRFRNEVQAAAKLEHDNVVSVYDVGEVDGQPYYAMRFVAGESLKDKIDEGLLPPIDAARYCEQVARALAAAHDRGILHRDLKPHNVMIDAQANRALLVDFGLAKLTESDQQLTKTDSVFGSPSYMSPEQAADAGKISESSDIYGLGATLYHLLTGRPPFQASTTFETLLLVKSNEPVTPRQLNAAIPMDLETICLKCLEKEPARRYAGAADLADELQRFTNGDPILARPINLLERTWRWCRRNPVIATLAAGACLLAITLLTILIVSNSRIRAAWNQQQVESRKAEAALVDSLLQQSQALWLARKPGWREQSLEALREAAAIEQRPELGQLAVQTVATWDWAPHPPVSLPTTPGAFVVSADSKHFATASGRTIYLGHPARPEEAELFWQAAEDGVIQHLCFHRKSDKLAWATASGSIYTATLPAGDVTEVTASMDAGAETPAVLALAFGPGESRISWVADERGVHHAASPGSPATAATEVAARLIVFDFVTGEAIRSELAEWRDPALMMQNNAELETDPSISAETALLTDPLGQFVVATGATLAPRLWRIEGEQLAEYDMSRVLPNGANVRLAGSPDGKFIYLACNEPRWGEQQVGGRLPPWVQDPLRNPRFIPGGVIESEAPGEVIDPEGGLEGASQSSSGGASGGSKEPPPPVAAPPAPIESAAPPEPADPNAHVEQGPYYFVSAPPPAASSGNDPRQQPPPPTGAMRSMRAADNYRFPHQSPPPTGGMRSGGWSSGIPDPPGTQASMGDDPRPQPPPPSEAGGRPLSPVLTGPVRRVYLYQFSVSRPAPEYGTHQSGIELERLDPRNFDEMLIYRMGDAAALSVGAKGDVLVAGAAGKAVVLRPMPPRLEVTGELQIDDVPIREGAIIGDNPTLVFATGQHSLVQFERAGGELNQLIRPSLPRDSSHTPWTKIAVSAATGKIAVANWEKHVEIRDRRTGRVERELPGLRYVRDLAWTGDGQLLEMLTPEDQQAMQLSPFTSVTSYAMSSRTQFTRSLEFPGVSVDLASPSWNLYGTRDGGLRLEPKTRIADENAAMWLGRRLDSPTMVRCVLAPGDRLIAATSDATVVQWQGPDFTAFNGATDADAADGADAADAGNRIDDESNTRRLPQMLCLNNNGRRWINDFACNPVNGELAVAMTDGRIARLTPDLQLLEELDAKDEVLRLTYDASGEYLLTGGRNGVVSVWNGEQRLIHWTGHASPIGYVAFEPAGQLVTASLDGEIRRWNLPKIRAAVEALGIDWLAADALQWEVHDPSRFKPAEKSAVPRSQDLAELPGWEAFAFDHKKCSVTTADPADSVRTPALKLETASEFDTGVSLDCRHYSIPVASEDCLSFWALPRAESGWQVQQPIVVLKFAGGEYRYEPASTPLRIGRWTRVDIPVAGDPFWRRTVEGSPDLDQLQSIEIHHDLRGAGMVASYDALRFSRPDSLPPIARYDERCKLGRVVDDELELQYHTRVAYTVMEEVQAEDGPRTITREEIVTEMRVARFSLDEPLPDFEFVPLTDGTDRATVGAEVSLGSFEIADLECTRWERHSWRRRSAGWTITEEDARVGSRSLKIASPELDDMSCHQAVRVEPHQTYRLSGYIKTRGVEIQAGGKSGACLSVWGKFTRTRSLSGDNDWTFVACVFNTGDRDEVSVGPRLGHHGSAASGTAWFDDLKLELLSESETEPEPPVPAPAPPAPPTPAPPPSPEPAPQPSAAETRPGLEFHTFRLRDGREAKAKFTGGGQRDGKTYIRLTSEAGKEVELPLDQFDEESQAWLKARMPQ